LVETIPRTTLAESDVDIRNLATADMAAQGLSADAEIGGGLLEGVHHHAF
jgi:hypothetical protein